MNRGALSASRLLRSSCSLLASGLLILAALAVGAREFLGLLLALFDLAVEPPAGLFPGDLPGLLDALVGNVRVLAGEVLGLIRHPAEIWHGCLVVRRGDFAPGMPGVTVYRMVCTCGIDAADG